MTRNLIYASIIICTAALSYGMGAKGLASLSASIGIILLGIVWIVALVRGVTIISASGFPMFILLSLIGIWINLSPWLMLTSITASIVTWDLIHFNQRLLVSGDVDDRRRMEISHFLRLGLVLIVGVLAYDVAMQVHMDLTFGGAALLALLGIWGVSALVYRLRSKE
jgi:hypothetical protein